MKSVMERKTEHNGKRFVGMLGVGVLMLFTATASAQTDYDEYRNSRYEQSRSDDRYDDRGQRSDRYDDRRESARYDDRRDDRRDERRRPSYRDCKDRAYDVTGYRGPSPSRYREGRALEGAIKGGLNAGAASWVTGGDKKEIRKAQKRGAKLGFIIGAIKQGAEREKQRKNDELRRDFEYEVRACMRDY
ncbi:hypothetical protein NBRC116583_12580 [Arenicella sp. 4NH20-0111]|uniref:hypothetical protein n=1 Tax=Arenicella sp. 4NH20-0111 TaxID=3127648 RepID=UPI003107C8CE